MSGNKKYFWLKINENFFEDDTIAWIEEQDNGKDYIIFYLKLALKSLTDDGYLIRYVGEKLIPYDVKALAKLTNTDTDTVKVAMGLFLEIGLISQLDSGEIYMTQIEEMVGSETRQASIMRKKRAREKLLLPEQKSNNVTPKSNNVIESYPDVNKSYTEIEIEKELELDIETERKNSPAKAEPSPSKKSKNKYGEFNNVLFTQEEYQKLQDRFPDIEQRINNLSFYIESKGAKYKSHYATILSWARRDEVAKPQKNGLPDNSDEFVVSQADIESYQEMIGRVLTANEIEDMKAKMQSQAKGG